MFTWEKHEEQSDLHDEPTEADITHTQTDTHTDTDKHKEQADAHCKKWDAPVMRGVTLWFHFSVD